MHAVRMYDITIMSVANLHDARLGLLPPLEGVDQPKPFSGCETMSRAS
jgi:hypothetical protein